MPLILVLNTGTTMVLIFIAICTNLHMPLLSQCIVIAALMNITTKILTNTKKQKHEFFLARMLPNFLLSRVRAGEARWESPNGLRRQKYSYLEPPAHLHSCSKGIYA